MATYSPSMAGAKNGDRRAFRQEALVLGSETIARTTRDLLRSAGFVRMAHQGTTIVVGPYVDHQRPS